MLSYRTSEHIRPFPALLLALGLMLAMLWLLGELILPARALPITPDQIKPIQPQALNVTLVVTSANDDGPGSLRRAIADASADDVITFDNNYTIYLSSTLTLTKELTIDGDNYTVTVSGDANNDDSRNVRVFFITSTAVVTLNHLNIISGTDDNFIGGYFFGGGIYVNPGSQLTVQGSTFAGNISGLSGGIYNGGLLTVMNSIFTGNTTASAGGGIYNAGELILKNSIFNGNASYGNGGGIYNSGRLTLADSTFTSNFADTNGGGIAGYGTFTVTNSLFVSNTANSEGGGIFVDGGGDLIVQDSTLSDNFAGYAGGGIENLGSLMLANSTLAENIAAYVGGGLHNYGAFTATNSTFSGNLAQGSDAQYDGGGAIDQWGPSNPLPSALLENVTFANNNAPNIATRDGLWLERGSMTLRNVLLADNGPANCTIEAGAMLTATTDSMADDITCIGATSVPSTSLALPQLADNGGSTWTHALLPGNPAINAGNDATCLSTDQRGVTRPQGLHCDIGAYEYQALDKYVAPPPLGNDANDCNSVATPCATISAAIGKASASETIHIATGMFTENLTISKSLGFMGAGESNTIIDGNLAGRVFSVTAGTTSIANLTIQGGSTSSDGGGIYAVGNLTLDHVTVVSNTASNDGGGIYNAGGIMMLSRSVISGNTISNTGNGNINGRGAGIYNEGDLEITDSSLIGNQVNISSPSSASAQGGGIYNAGALTLTNASILGNVLNNQCPTSMNEGSGVYNSGSTTMDNVSLRHNAAYFASFSYGGGLYSSGTLNLMNSTVSDNNIVSMAPFNGGGGGIYTGYFNVASITNTTIYSNSTNVSGGGIYGRGTLTVVNATIVSNTANMGGNIQLDVFNPSAFRNTIFAYGNPDNCSGPVTSQGHNLDSGNTCVFAATGDITDVAPVLGPLQDNGGATLTTALLAGSPAIDSGNDATCPATDQRGSARPQGAHCDIGAYEFAYEPAYHFVINHVGNGDGIVTFDPPGPSYAAGTGVTLTATPFISSTFVDFSGDVVTTTPHITLTIDSNKSVTATFALKTFVITPTASANGSIAPATPQTVNYGASQTFTTTPDSDYRIADVGVDGVSQGPIGFYTFADITANHTLTAAFAVNVYTLTVNYAGIGTGVVRLDPPGPTYTPGTVVTFTATPSITSAFVGWSGDVATIANPITVTMTGNKTIMAVFTSFRIFLPLVRK